MFMPARAAENHCYVIAADRMARIPAALVGGALDFVDQPAVHEEAHQLHLVVGQVGNPDQGEVRAGRAGEEVHHLRAPLRFVRDLACVDVRLRPQVFQEVRRNDAIIQCFSCNRTLYYVAPPPPV